MFNDILAQRENRHKIILELSKKSDVLSIKANVVGAIKNLPTSRLLLSYFTKKIQKLGVKDLTLLQSSDGDTAIASVGFGSELKEKAVDLEETDTLGRFIDIDVTLKGQEKSLSRKTQRKCFLCSNPAFVCGKNKTHTLKELLDFFNEKTQREIYKLLENIIFESLMGELNLENKFGLVSPTDNGSHADLNYDLMKTASIEIAKVLPKAFFVGLNSPSTDGLLEKLREIGLTAEQSMFNVTNGANAYKGFIFIACVLLGAFGYVVVNNLPYENIYLTAKEICSDIDVVPPSTFGYKAYLNGFGGIRKTAKDGFVVVEHAKNLINENNLLEVLTKIVGLIDDSVLLKRAKSIERYNHYKNLISSVDCTDTEKVKTLTQQCKKDNVSIGGSADALISAILMKKIA
ncbi:MAG: triphosphoribosyl-dephospho-CoA synthase [Clostridia bacterium]|nr:triphosphoribosyl-dephospho-CoA synthase [Clostridia bacterium]